MHHPVLKAIVGRAYDTEARFETWVLVALTETDFPSRMGRTENSPAFQCRVESESRISSVGTAE